MKALLTITARRPEDTARFGASLGLVLGVGDCVTLAGPLGVGKSELARGLVRAALADETADVPSPTFTLVQTYDTPVPLAHADLYRLVDPQEWEELGLDEALGYGAVVIEWPDRAGRFLPRDRLDILGHWDERGGRLWTIYGSSLWAERLMMDTENRE